MASNFDPYWEWLKIPANQQPPNHYRLLGLKPLESNSETIDTAVNRLVEKLQRLSNGPQVEAAQKILNQVAQARLCFNDPAKKQIYDSQLTARLTSQQGANSTASPANPKPQNGRPSDPGKPSVPTRKIPVKPGAPAASKTETSKPAATTDSNRQVRLMKFATAGMLALGSIVGSLFVWFTVDKRASREEVPKPVTFEVVETPNNKMATNEVNPANNAVGAHSDIAKNPTSPAEMQPISDGFSQAAKAAAGGLGLDSKPNGDANAAAPTTGSPSQVVASTPATITAPTKTASASDNTTSVSNATPVPTPTETTPVPANGLQAISGLPDTFVPGKPNLFEQYVDSVVGLQGQAVNSRTSTSGKTVYLMFSHSRDDLIEIRARTQKVSLDSLKSFAGKTIRVRGPLKREFGSRVIGLEIETVEQIEIVE